MVQPKTDITKLLKHKVALLTEQNSTETEPKNVSTQHIQLKRFIFFKGNTIKILLLNSSQTPLLPQALSLPVLREVLSPPAPTRDLPAL
jgi:hypothetical protein